MWKAALKRREMMIRIELYNRTTEFYKHIFRKYTTKCKKNEKREIIWQRQNTKEKKINFLCAKSKTGNEGNPEGKL